MAKLICSVGRETEISIIYQVEGETPAALKLQKTLIFFIILSQCEVHLLIQSPYQALKLSNWFNC